MSGSTVSEIFTKSGIDANWDTTTISIQISAENSSSIEYWNGSMYEVGLLGNYYTSDSADFKKLTTWFPRVLY